MTPTLKLLVTFYGEKEVEEAEKIRTKILGRYKSINDGLKKILTEWSREV